MTQTDMNGTAQTDTPTETGLDVRLETVGRARPEISLESRNPFRYGDASVGSGFAGSPGPFLDDDDDAAGAAPQTIPVTPTVRLRMIGVVDAVETTGAIAVLTDGDVVLYGREGEIVDGRYRILNVRATSVELEVIDDGRRLVLRMEGT